MFPRNSRRRIVRKNKLGNEKYAEGRGLENNNTNEGCVASVPAAARVSNFRERGHSAWVSNHEDGRL